MNKVITINLNGNAYQLEEDGYEALRAYLETAARRLEGNPDKDEIIADIEQAIADKFRALLGVNKTVVVSSEVRDVIAEMGPVQDASAASDDSRSDSTDGGRDAKDVHGAAASPGVSTGSAKHLFRVREGAMIGGVCTGLAAYLGIDVAVIRTLFLFFTLTFGASVVLYVLMMIVIPAANTPAEMDAAYGSPSTAEEFIRRAKEGYYEGMKSFGDRKAFREWKWKFKQDMRQYRREMRQKALQWRWNCHQQWAQNPNFHPGSWVLGSFFGLATALLTVLCILSIASLVVTGTVFGILFFSGLPLWVGIILLIVLFELVKWPLRAMRHAMYYPGYCGPVFMGPFVYLWHSFGWLLLIILIVWIVDRHSPQVHDTLIQLRHELHRLVDSLRDWWARP